MVMGGGVYYAIIFSVSLLRKLCFAKCVMLRKSLPVDQAV